jgi:hypothetical protein
VKAPDDEARHRSLQEWYIGCDQKKAKWKHPEPKDRQDGKDAAHDESNARRKAHPARRRMPQPSHDGCHARRQLLIEPPECLSQFLLAGLHINLTAIRF